MHIANLVLRTVNQEQDRKDSHFASRIFNWRSSDANV